MSPTIGRIVHFYTSDPNDAESQHAAIIANVHDSKCVNLRVIARHNATDWYVTSAVFSEQPKQGCWSWPVREAMGYDSELAKIKAQHMKMG